MTEDFARAFAFMRRGDIRGTTERPFRFGTAIFTPELPLRYDSNLLYVDRLPSDTSGDRLREEAERVFAEAGFAHRALLIPDAETGERVATAFAGWDVHRNVVMAHKRTPERPIDTSAVAEVNEAALRPARRAQIESYPWGSPAVAQQLLDAKLILARWQSVRCFALLVNGQVASYTDLYTEQDDAQIEDVATLPEYRRRGYAKAVVMRAVEEARAAGATFVFLVADERDWPKELYTRLGFETVGRYLKLVRPESG